MWTITVNGHTPPSFNAIKDMHWAELVRIKREWFYHMWLSARDLGIPAPKGKRRVTITRFFCSPEREYDMDNYIAGCKSTVLDRLKPSRVTRTGHHYSGLGVILDDNPDAVDVEYVQERVQHRNLVRTEIIVEDA
jgi:hypothetical protein